MTRPLRVIFLDYDGVLHPVSALARFAMRMSRDDAIRQGRLFRWTWVLEEILHETDVRIVVHSSWRCLLSTAEMLEYLGPLAVRYSGATNAEMLRWEGIQRTVNQLGLGDEQWLVLDDHASQFPDPPPRQLVLCNPENGIWDQQVRERVRAWVTGNTARNKWSDDDV